MNIDATSTVVAKEEVLDHFKISSLFIQLQDLKRQQPLGYSYSITEHLFIEGWNRIIKGENIEQVAGIITAKALLSITFPGFESGFFKELDLEKDKVTNILYGALYQYIKEYEINKNLANLLIDSLHHELGSITEGSITGFTKKLKTEAFQEQAPFVYQLVKQPRAGATNPNSSRMLLLPPESHADHCLVTAVYSVLLAPTYEADFGTSFLIAMSHHLHNASLPDMGYAGEMALGDHLQFILDQSRRKALAVFPMEFQLKILDAIYKHEDISLPEGQASAAADVSDRVLDIYWRIKATKIDKKQLLDDLELIHPGPIQHFQNSFIRSLQLWNR
ncbi:hypothetical protein NBT05_09780 [Aquimarina sp. ERC-38]|uniref:hypothetical protein n=1 Tax=Aquimarina sp. ERC-38 TaxID=2949996 RepID=UPI0022475C49|nr:hypothetical protein [Aquimarina sp. ERC-38]UZO79260.1 hypothetical protein NBT05_09780 [Aquimarina sp. ERC-38]